MANNTGWEPTFLDSMHESCTTFKTMGDFSTFEAKLPEELRVAIFRNVGTGDAKALAIVCRTFRTAAEQVLYETISNIRHMNHLYRKLVARPELANLVKSIDLRPLLRETTIPAVVHHCSSFGMTDDDYRFHMPITENRMVGLILRALPKLESLDISIMYPEDRYLYTEDGYNNATWHSAHPLVAVLGSAYDPSKGNHMNMLSQIPGFKNLKNVTYDGASFPSSLGSLPNIDNVRLTKNCSFIDEPEKDAGVFQSKASEFSLGCGSSILSNFRRSKYEYLGSCLKQFICLKTLTIDILEQYSDPHEDPGDCSVMLDRLGDLREKIETINLLVAHPRGDLQYMDFVYPVSTMTAFSGLKHLTMPYEWIEKVDNETDITTEFSQVFPQTQEMLELQIPEKHTCEWLLEFAKQRSTSNFRRLREFRLYCSERRGLSYETFLYDSRYAKQVKNIADTGILIEVSYDPTEYKSYWGNKDYDPMSKIMADELRSLTVIYRHETLVAMAGLDDHARRLIGALQIVQTHTQLPSRWVI